MIENEIDEGCGCVAMIVMVTLLIFLIGCAGLAMKFAVWAWEW